VVGIPVQADGPDIEALEQALAIRVPKFFYIIPDFQNPAGVTCSGAKRQQIVKLADRHGFLLVEDAPYRLLRYRGREEPTLYELAPEITLHMSSFTKLIAPGVRTGFMIGEPKLIAHSRRPPRTRTYPQATSLRASPTNGAAAVFSPRRSSG
jgi:2-aminoadipate transaminase